MISNREDKDSYGLSTQDERELQEILNERKKPDQQGGQGCEQGETTGALEDDVGLELMEYVLKEEDNQYLSSERLAQRLEIDASNYQIGHRIRMIGDSLGLEREEVSRFYSTNTTWDLDLLRANGLDKLYEKARSTS